MVYLSQAIATNDRERRILLEAPSRNRQAEGIRTGVSAAEAMSIVEREIAGSARPRDLLLYLHVPFCSSKCLFCDWVADVPVPQLRAGEGLRREYVEGLVRQVGFLGPRLRDMGYAPRHAYWGGGTPSRLDARDLEQIVGALDRAFDLRGIGEHTLEASPETLTPAKLGSMLAAGVNRISMGVQSFNDEELRRSGRAHSAAQAEDAIAMIREAGFANWNLDLIVALPDQTSEMLQHTLGKAVRSGAPHITVYVYRATAQTVMAEQMRKGHRERVGFHKIYRSYCAAQAALKAAGYEEYSFGYFAKRAEHRFKGEAYYYEFQGDYVGFGSGAGSILGHHYFKNASDDLHRFIRNPLAFEHCVRLSAVRLDLLADALRLALLTDGGIRFENFERLFGFEFSELRRQELFAAYLDAFRQCGAEFVESAGHLAVTPSTRIWMLLAA
jgi:oxygen-independent coproporphyrinogen-3 oxidase